MLIFDSSDSENDLAQYSSLSIAPQEEVKAHSNVRFVQELEPIPVYLFSMRDDVSLIPDYISLLKKSIPSDHPFISVDSEWRHNTLDVIQLGTPSICMVIQIHGITALHHDISDLLTNPNVVKVFKAKSEDVTRIKKSWGVDVVSVYDVQPYFQDIGRIYASKVGKGRSELGDFSHPLSTFAAHGYTLLCTKGKGVTMSNWSTEILSEKQIEYAALDAFWIAFNYYLKISNMITEDPHKHTCVFFSDSSPTQVPEHPFQTTLLLSTRSTSWLGTLKPFCCDIHYAHNVLEKNFDEKTKSTQKSLSKSLRSFASVLFNILSHPFNSSYVQSLQPSNDFSFFFEKRDTTVTSIVNLCVRILLPLLSNQDVLISFTALKFPQKYPLYILSVAFNLLALAVDSSSLVSVEQLTVTKEMLSGKVICGVLDQAIETKLMHIWTKIPKICPVCSDLPNASYFSVTASKSNSGLAIQALLNSISSTNPRVTVFARSVVSVIDQIILASNSVILNFAAGIDRVVPPLLQNLLSNNVISKDFVGLSCTPQDVADFFFLQNFVNVVDRSILVPSSVLDLVNSEFNERTANWAKLSSHIVSEFHQIPVFSSLEPVVSLTFILHYFFQSTDSNLQCQSFTRSLANRMHPAPESELLVSAHEEVSSKTEKQKSMITIVPYNSAFNQDDVLYHSHLLGLVALTSSNKSSHWLPLYWFIDEKFVTPSLLQTLNLFKRFKLCAGLNVRHLEGHPVQIKIWFKKLSELLAMELLFVKDDTFGQDLLSVEFHKSTASAFEELGTLIREKKMSMHVTKPNQSNEQNAPSIRSVDVL
ncbi:hypothetical protein GEMRC1_011294 [Eukaryota sp. GEM-RC1]